MGFEKPNQEPEDKENEKGPEMSRRSFIKKAGAAGAVAALSGAALVAGSESVDAATFDRLFREAVDREIEDPELKAFMIKDWERKPEIFKQTYENMAKCYGGRKPRLTFHIQRAERIVGSDGSVNFKLRYNIGSTCE